MYQMQMRSGMVRVPPNASRLAASDLLIVILLGSFRQGRPRNIKSYNSVSFFLGRAHKSSSTLSKSIHKLLFILTQGLQNKFLIE